MSKPHALARRVRGTVLRSAFSVLVFFLALLVLEIFFRSTHALGARMSWSEPDDVLGYRYTPGASYWYLRENDRPIQGRINRFGWRDSDWSVEKPDGVIRVAVLGDSYVEAFQVESEATFLKLAEDQLNTRPGKRFEFMNFGRSGFTQTEELIVLQEDVLPFSPDVVVLFFFPANDIADISPGTSMGGARPYFRVGDDGALKLDTTFNDSRNFKLKKRINWFKQNSALLSLATERWVEFNIKRGQRQRARGAGTSEYPTALRGYLSLYTDRPEESYLRSYELCKLLIRRMQSLATENGFRFMLACINEVYTPEVDIFCKKLDPNFDADFFERDLRDFADSIHTDYIDLQGIFKDHYRKNGVALHFGAFDPSTMNMNGGHWNYEGHEVVADALALALQRLYPDSHATDAGASRRRTDHQTRTHES